MNKLLVAAQLLVLGTVLEATVFRDQVATAAALLDVHITNLDAGGNVKVHEQGTAAVSGTVGLSATGNTVKLDPTANTVRVAASAGPAATAYATGCVINLPDSDAWEQASDTSGEAQGRCRLTGHLVDARTR